ncbi:hypothetical protein AIOL_003897 [Candidatus Rhodobacter oscarellae]|uniref:Uncharacterized protein n=1 Tax=Candidatus Rhodobacter oscarellae TaxID=1675527 RepID=A0A0J9E854_9RHOB|nr:hypothetical protein [Candidatus Rhodobacter lobularis]KMW58916.1 hypothetical protein AIOL_003897 [Candidatus Rhodobacter lobularis]
MADAQVLRVYLDETDLARAVDGSFNIMNKIRSAFEGAGYRVEFVKSTAVERAKSAACGGYALFHMEDPFHSRALTLRRAYFYPFWRIESSAKRWEWQIAKTKFDPEAVNRKAADRFVANTRKRLFGEISEVETDSTVYIPLQGRLLDRRSFQTQSPLDMIRSVLAHEQDREIVVGLHPNEAYTTEETDALRDLADQNRRLTLSSEPMVKLLQRCDYVVTENSSVALSGYFFEKPAVLFAQIDFHHIAANVSALGAEAAIASAPDLRPDFAGYLHWFLKKTTINGGAPEAEAQILAAVRCRGWKI